MRCLVQRATSHHGDDLVDAIAEQQTAIEDGDLGVSFGDKLAV